MTDPISLSELSEPERERALARFRRLQPFFAGQSSLSQVAKQEGLALRTAQRWAARYRQLGLAGLGRKPRSDQGSHRLPPELQSLIEGLALQQTKPSAASIHRQVAKLCPQHGWKLPSYDCVYAVVRQLEPALLKLAHQGSQAYRDAFDLVHRREASYPNEIWQADHTLLNIWLLTDEGPIARPWLTVIEDDYSRCIVGYYLSFETPNTLKTALALRQAIWHKMEARWPMCGIPETFYTDHGSDFTSDHMAQVSADLKMALVFSMAGIPRGRGRIERFFQTVDQLFLHLLPGYTPEGKPLTPPALTLAAFEPQFLTFVLDDYHQRRQRDLAATPYERWTADRFLPRMPDTLAQLDLLLLTFAKPRRVRRDGIHFQNHRYIDPILADYVGEDVTIRYNPRDMAELWIYHQNRFVCRAICQELAGQTVTLKQIMQARHRRQRELRQVIADHAALIQTYLDVHQPPPEFPELEPPPLEPTPATPKPAGLKGYVNE